MPIFDITAPDGKSYRVTGPEGSTEADALQQLKLELGISDIPDVPTGPSAAEIFAGLPVSRSPGRAFSKAVGRGASRLASTATDILPAFGASALGFDDYARQQMEEAAAKEAQLQRANPAEFGSFRDVEGPGDFLTYLAELSGEQVPNLLTSIGTGGAGAAIAGAAAKSVAKGAVIGAGAGSVGLNTPEIFQNIYEETGKLEPALAAVFGTVAGALDTIFPAAVVKSLQSNPALKKAVIATIAERKGILPEVLKGAAKAAALEGATEGAQEALSITAEQIASDTQKFWGQKEFDRVLESAVAGALVSAPLGGIGGGAAAIRSRPAAEEAPPEAPAPVTPDIFKVKPPAEGAAAKGSVFDRIAAASTKEELDAIQTEIKNTRDISNTAIRDKYQPAISARREQLEEEAAKKPVKPIDTTNMPAGMSEEEWASLEANPPGGKKASAAPTVTVNKEFVNKVKASIAATVSAGNPVSIAEISEKSGLKNAKDLKKLVDSLLKSGTLKPTDKPFVYSYGTPKPATAPVEPAAPVEPVVPVESEVTATPVEPEVVEVPVAAAEPEVIEEPTVAEPVVAEPGVVEEPVAAVEPEVAAEPAPTPVEEIDAKAEEVAKAPVIPNNLYSSMYADPGYKDLALDMLAADMAQSSLFDTVTSPQMDDTLATEEQKKKDLAKFARADSIVNSPTYGTKNTDFGHVGVAVHPNTTGKFGREFWNTLNDAEKARVKTRVMQYLRGGGGGKSFAKARFSKRNGVAQAAFVPSEKLAVYAPGLSAKEMRALRAHEVGAHYSVEKMLGEDKYQQLLRDLSALRGKSKMVDTAYRLVPRDTPSYLVNHEALAYLVEHYERLPLVKRLLQAVRDWWNKTFKGQTLTPTDLRDMVRAAMMKYETDVREEILTSGTVEERVKDYPDAQFSKGQKLLANSSDLASNSQYLYDRLANASDAALAKIPSWGQGVATKIADFIEMGPVRGSGRVLAGLLDMRQLAEVAGQRNPELGVAIKKVEKVVGERDRDMAKGREEVEKFLKHASEVVKSVTPEQRKAFNRVVNESTLRQIDPTTDRDHFLAKDYDALPQSLQKLYVELRDTYAQFVEDYTDILRNEPVLGPASKVLADLMSKGIKPYFPLHRRGEFWLQYIDPTTKEEAVSAFETPRERREFVRFLQVNGAEAKDIVEFARISEVTTESLPPTSQFRKVLQTLRESGKVEQPVIDEVYKMYLNLFPNQSIMQQFHTRKGTAGFLEDPINVYADVGTRMAMNLAQVKSMKKIDDALDEAKGATSERASGFDATIIDSLEGRERYLKSPIQKGALGAFASFAGYNSYRWFIMGNMSSALINLTQSLIQYGMLAGKYGPVKAFNAMRDATGMYFRGGRDNNTSVENPFTGRAMNDLTFGGDKSKGKLSQEEQDLYDIAVSRGTIRRSTGQDLMQMREKGIDDPTSKWVQTQHWLGWMFQNTERFNREVGLLAAYKLARQNGVPHADAIEQAINEVGEVHGSAMAELGPEYFQSGFGKIIGTFKRFAMSQIYLQYKLMRDMFKGASPEVKREAAMQYLAINSVAWTFAGLKGMPIFGLANLATSVLDWMFGDDDEPFDLDNYVLANLGNAMYRGPIGALINADIGSRSGFSDLLWRPDPKRLAEVGLGAYVMEQMLGPAFGIYKSVEQGVEHFNNGDLYRALESSSPAAIRNFLKGLRFSYEGAVNTKGYPIDGDISAKDAFMQILGFTPNDVADKYARNNIMKQAERRMDEKKRSLLARHNLARSEKDMDEMREIRAEMVEFNRSTLGRFMPITFGNGGTVEKSWNAWNQQRQAALNGVVLKPKLKQALKEEAGIEE